MYRLGDIFVVTNLPSGRFSFSAGTTLPAVHRRRHAVEQAFDERFELCDLGALVDLGIRR
jgi:hypothetical protein